MQRVAYSRPGHQTRNYVYGETRGYSGAAMFHFSDETWIARLGDAFALRLGA